MKLSASGGYAKLSENNYMNKVNKFKKSDILALVIGSIIGWGSFTLPGKMFLPEAGLINTILAFMAGAVAILFIQAGYHLMMKDQDEDGGEFSYTYKYLGSRNGFIAGWGLTLCYLSIVPLNATAFVQIFRLTFGEKMNIVHLYNIGGEDIYLTDVLIASAILIIFWAINKRGVRLSAGVQNFLTGSLIGVVLILATIMFIKLDLSRFKEIYFVNDAFNLAKSARILAIVPFLFVGFDVIPQVVTDLNFPKKRAGLLAVTGIASGALIYSLLCTMCAMVYSPEEAVAREWALGEAVLSTLSWPGFAALILALFAAVSAGINGFLISSTRLCSALSDYDLLPASFRKTNKYGIKGNALNFVTAVSLIAPWFGRAVIGYIVDMSSLLAALAYFYVCLIGVKTADRKLLKYASAVGMLMSFIFMLLLIIPSSPAFLSKEARIFLYAWIILGFFYYCLSSKRMKNN